MKTLEQDFPMMPAGIGWASANNGLAKLREPFPAHQISKLPKGTKAQNECAAADKINCKVCGGWHHPKIIHLDYVGHAALTDRLLDADPGWTWEPMALRDGLPAFDETGGLWIKLTVCGQTRIGYGHAMSTTFKDIGSREKEVIGDALRNAAMRFGAALDLWHKGELHVDEPETKKESTKSEARSEWDKLDEETQKVMTNEAMAVTVLTADGDIEGAYHHLESLKLEDDYKVAFWSRLDATQRSALKACGQLIRANNSTQLMTAWGSVPKHSQTALTALKERRKQELQPMEAAA